MLKVFSQILEATDGNLGRVHFASQQLDTEHELGIIIREKGDDIQEVHLGWFLLELLLLSTG